jgi:hypothetical protein
MALGLTGAIALAMPRGVAADDQDPGSACSNRTLRGDYGYLVSGVRGLDPITTESFVGVGVRTFDGQGGFTDVATFHGQLTGVQEGEATGTYSVNANCSGTSTLFIPNLPFPIVSSFVIVGHGRELKEAVTSPQPNIVTAEYVRK